MSKDKRFEKLYSDGGFLTTNEIWVDTATGVQYFYHAAGNSGGLCPLLDAEGGPLISRGRSACDPEL